MTDRLVITDGDVDTAVIADYERSRRELVRRGLTAGGAVLAAASIPTLLRVRDAFAQADDDPGVLSAAIEFETTIAEAYQRSQDTLGGIARLFRSQEREHLGALDAALRQMGGTPPNVDVDSRLSSLGNGRRGVLSFLRELEDNGLRAYLDAHRRVRDARVMQLLTSILTNEAQHLVVLRQQQGGEPIPSPFETGRR